MIENAGGAAEVAKKLEHSHGLSPLLIAIEILGGVPEAAVRIGTTRQGLDKMLKAGPDQMRGVYLRKISELTMIPVATLMLSGPAVRRAATKRKAGK